MTEQQKTLTTKFQGFLERMKPNLALALPKHLNSDRFARLVMTQFNSTPALRECDSTSIAASVMTAAQLGLEIGINGQGYLIPYRTKGAMRCQFVPGWKGLVDLVARSGRGTVWTGAVFAGDSFDYQLGDSPYCRHKPGDEADGEFTHVYAIGRVRDADLPVIEVWSRKKVANHLAKYNKVGEKHYATTDETNFEMYARKAALLQVLKYMPMSIEVANAIEVTQAADAGRNVIIDAGMVFDAQPENAEQGEQAEPIDASGAQITDCPEQKIIDFVVRIEQGKVTAENAINTLLTRHTLTDLQKKRLETAKPL